MALPIPIPDNPLKWEGWRSYESSNMYDRLCLDAGSNPPDELIETNCRELLVWWSKKLPLKSQPSNPVAQLLRGGLDDAPRLITEAKTCLLDKERRAKIDAVLHEQLVSRTKEDFKKLVSFSLSNKTITDEEEQKLLRAGYDLGLTDEDMQPLIDAEIARTGSERVKFEAPAPPPPPQAAPVAPVPSSLNLGSASNPFDEFRKILRMSRLNVGDDEMTDDQRDAMCNLGESLGLTGGQAEDVIDEYLEEMASMPIPVKPPSPFAKPSPSSSPKPVASGGAKAPISPVRSPVAQQTASPVIAKPGSSLPRTTFSVSPMAKAAERQRHLNFTNQSGIEFYLIPSGRFKMGSDAPDAQGNEQPVTQVTLSCFYMSRFPVTNAQFERFDPNHRAKRPPWADDNHPVVHITALEADAFCNWLSEKEKKVYRLPTEYEWEYAARGEEGKTFPWGEGLKSGEYANFADRRTQFAWKDPLIDDGWAQTSPIGMYPRGASPFGIEEMAGNVFEWCLNGMEPYKGKELVNPKPGPSPTSRVYRGGSWRSRAASLRAAARGFNAPTFQSHDVGFRVVCECP